MEDESTGAPVRLWLFVEKAVVVWRGKGVMAQSAN